MKRKIIVLFLLLAFSVLFINSNVYANQRKIRKVVLNYWKKIQNNDLKGALKDYSVYYYMKRVYPKQIRKLSVSDKIELIQLLNKMQLQNLKNLARNLLKPGTDAKVVVKGINSIKKVATCKMILSYTVGTKRFNVELSHYMNKVKKQWKICDFRINNKWDSDTMKELVKNLNIKDFLNILRVFYSPKIVMKNYKSPGNEVSMDIPSSFIPVAKLTGKKADYGEILLAFERNYLGILVIKSSQTGEYKIDSMADKLRSNVIVSGSQIISDEFYEVNKMKVFTLSSVRVDKNMPGNFAYTDFTFLIKGKSFYTVIINSPDQWALKLFSFHKDMILNSLKIKD